MRDTWPSLPMKLALLFVTLIIGMVFLSISDGDSGIIGFWFVDYKIRFQDWTYFLGDHLIKIILAYVILAEAVKWRTALKAFLLIQVLDMVDYLATFNTKWFIVNGFEVSFNVLASVVFALVIVYEYGRAID